MKIHEMGRERSLCILLHPECAGQSASMEKIKRRNE
jgi:hypothetical protein